VGGFRADRPAPQAALARAAAAVVQAEYERIRDRLRRDYAHASAELVASGSHLLQGLVGLDAALRIVHTQSQPTAFVAGALAAALRNPVAAAPEDASEDTEWPPTEADDGPPGSEQAAERNRRYLAAWTRPISAPPRNGRSPGWSKTSGGSAISLADCSSPTRRPAQAAGATDRPATGGGGSPGP